MRLQLEPSAHAPWASTTFVLSEGDVIVVDLEIAQCKRRRPKEQTAFPGAGRDRHGSGSWRQRIPPLAALLYSRLHGALR